MYIFRHMTSTEELSVYLLIRKDLVLNLADKTGIDVTLYAVDIGVRGFLPQLGRLHHEMAIVTEAGHRGHGNGQIDGGEPQEANSHEKKDKIPHANTYRPATLIVYPENTGPPALHPSGTSHSSSAPQLSSGRHPGHGSRSGRRNAGRCGDSGDNPESVPPRCQRDSPEPESDALLRRWDGFGIVSAVTTATSVSAPAPAA